MDILITPDIGYTLFMISVLLTLMALLSPGSGFLEIGALAVIILTGYTFMQIPVNVWALAVLLLAVVPFYLAVWKGYHKAFLAASILILLVGGAFLFKGENWFPPVHPLLILFISILEGGAIWVAAQKAIETLKKTPVQDLRRLIGAYGEAKTDVHDEGSVLVNSELWSARSKAPIAKGKRVRVINRDGLILIVEKSERGK
jgi:membrane-bound serine protease (ClpP class)